MKFHKVIPALCLLFVTACETPFDNKDSGIPIAGPQTIQVMGKNAALFVQWTKVASAQGIIPYYEVYYGTSNAPQAANKLTPYVYSNDSNLVTAEISGLTNYTTYYVWVKAVFEGIGSSDYSPTESGSPIPPPLPPSGVQARSSENGIELVWQEGKDAFLYEVYYSAGGGGSEPSGGAEMLSVSSLGAFVAGLNNGSSYSFWIRSTNTAGTSNYVPANGSPAQQSTAPGSPPSNIKAAPGDKKLTLKWTQVQGVPRYKIFYNTQNNSASAVQFSTLIPADSPEVTAELTGLSANVSCYVWVKSSNSAGDSAFSAVVTGTPVAKTPIDWNNMQMELGESLSEFPFAEDMPPSVFFGANGRPNTDRLTRVHETALGNLFTDAGAWYARNVLNEQIDFVFLNGSFIDNALPKGKIKLSTIAGMVKPDGRSDKIVFLSLSGSDLKKFMGLGVPVDMLDPVYMASVASVPHTGHGSSNTGFFGNVSKELRYTLEYPRAPSGYEPMLTREDSEPYYHGRIKSGTLKLNGADIVDDKSYRICTTDYNYSGIFFTLLRTNSTNVKSPGVLYWHAVSEYIYDKGTITPQTDGRIKIEGGVPLPPPWAPGDWVLP